MENHAFFAAKLADGFHILNHADLIIGGHNRNEDGLIGDGVAELIQIDKSFLLYR